MGRSGRGTGEMAGVVSATAPTDGQTVTLPPTSRHHARFRADARWRATNRQTMRRRNSDAHSDTRSLTCRFHSLNMTSHCRVLSTCRTAQLHGDVRLGNTHQHFGPSKQAPPVAPDGPPATSTPCVSLGGRCTRLRAPGFDPSARHASPAGGPTPGHPDSAVATLGPNRRRRLQARSWRADRRRLRACGHARSCRRRRARHCLADRRRPRARPRLRQAAARRHGPRCPDRGPSLPPSAGRRSRRRPAERVDDRAPHSPPV